MELDENFQWLGGGAGGWFRSLDSTVRVGEACVVGSDEGGWVHGWPFFGQEFGDDVADYGFGGDFVVGEGDRDGG